MIQCLHIVRGIDKHGEGNMSKSRSRSRDFHRNNEVIDFDLAREKRKKARLEKAERIYQARKEAPSQRKAAKRKRRLLIYAAIIIFVVAAVSVSLVEIISLEKEKAELVSEKTRLTKELEDAQNELASTDDPEYIEQQVREKLNMVYPGEIIYISPDEEDKIDDKDK